VDREDAIVISGDEKFVGEEEGDEHSGDSDESDSEDSESDS
jgi:hypothetical protein